MINDKVKEFNCYGGGWIFPLDEGEDIDLKKFAWNKGYTLFFQHFGVLDPIFGDYESSTPWPKDADFVKYVLEVNGLVDAWLSSEPIKQLADALDIEANRENLESLIKEAIDFDYGQLIEIVIRKDLGFGNGLALCGITDKNYFMYICQQIGIDLADDDLVDVVFLG